MSRDYRAVPRKEFLKEMSTIATEVASIVGSTMTSNGDYVVLHDGSSTNDGAKIVSRLNQIHFGHNKIQRMFISKLIEATEKTDELAGDGTSATTMFTASLINYINRAGKFVAPEMIKKLNEAESIMLKELAEQKQDLVKEKDYVNLATVSVKDKKLGKLIGKEIYAAGSNAALQLRIAEDKPEDYVEKKSHFVVPYSAVGYGVPERMIKPEVITIDSLITDQDALLKQLLGYAFTKNKSVLLIAKEVDETAWTLIMAANKENEGKGQVGFIQAPELSKSHTARKVLEDISAYVGSDIYNKESFISNPNKINEIKRGSVDLFNMDKEGTFLSRATPSTHALAKVKELTKEMNSLSKDTKRNEIITLKNRINMLQGTTITVYVYERTQSALETKIDRIQDAVKATQFSLGYGYLPGAGVFYKKVESKYENEIISILSNDFHNNLYRAMGTTMLAKAKQKITAYGKEKSTNIGKYLDENGDVFKGDVINAGIIDSARVVENVIKNSFTIAREFARVGTMIIMEEQDAKD